MGVEISVIVGLGNPGQQYEGTRHNIGFAIVDDFISRFCKVTYNRQDDSAHVRRVECEGRELWVIKPLTFMNRSGEPVSRVLQSQGRVAENILVAHDELDLPLGAIRLKVGGGEGGHNGLRSMSASFGQGYHRLRAGIGRPDHPGFEISRWVLTRFSQAEAAVVGQTLERASDAIKVAITQGVSVAQNLFHSDKLG